MSLILEALKKSERQRRLSEVPTLTTPIIATQRQRSLLPFLVVVIVLALGVGWWLLRVPETPPASAPVASASPSAVPSGKPADAASYVEAAHDASPAPPAPTLPTLPPHTAATTKPARSNAVADTLPAQPEPDNQRPSAIVLPSNPPPVLSGPAPRPTAGASAASGTAAIKLPVATAAKSPDSTLASVEPRMATAAVTAPPPTNTAAAAPSVQPPPPPPGPALPSIWDLPYSTRKGLPDITMTMHVYSADPRGRFVIIAGDRHVEGDDLGGGVMIREIRADGMVLDFHGQKFLYPRDGR
jgi:general secretion pathway protein B